MKKWGIILILGLGIVYFGLKPFITSEVIIKETGIALNAADSKDRQTLEISIEQIHLGNLLLVNHEHPVHEAAITADVIHLQTNDALREGYSLLYDDIYLSEEIANKFLEMIAAADKEGIHDFSVNSGYRSFDAQEALFQEMGDSLALPAGYSEHNLGLALDVGSTQTNMAEAPEGKWIEENAWKYGFILRYPLHKTDITGIQYEPWHIRYVGLPHSAIMQEKDYVLEEYLDYLKKENRITASFEDNTYIVTYYTLTQNKLIEVPEKSDYDISGNNMDGVIVTIYE